MKSELRPTPFPTFEVAGLPISAGRFEEAISWLFDTASLRLPATIRFVNAFSVALTDTDRHYQNLLRTGGVNLADGSPVALLMRLQGAKGGRIRGPSFFEASLAEAETRQTPVFFLGSTPSALKKREMRALCAYARLNVSGSFSPPFAKVDAGYIRLCVEAIPHSAAIVWVATGTPQQDFLATALAEHLGRPCVGVGAAFDFLAGTVREAPRLIQQLGLEWVFRFAMEPRRLARRYTLGNVTFIKLALRSLVSTRLSRNGK